MTVKADKYVAMYFDALGAIDTVSAERLVTELLESGTGLGWIVSNVILPAQRRVGDAWEAEKWNVAQEHAATSISEQVLAVLGSAQRELSSGKQLVVACVEDELHSLPARATATVLAGEGHRLTYLGASVPAADLRRFVAHVRPEAVLLSCLLTARIPQAARAVNALHGLTHRILVGGTGFGPEGVWATKLGDVTWARDAEQVMEFLDAPLPALSGGKAAPRPRPHELDVDRIGARRDHLIDRGMTVLSPHLRKRPKRDDMFALFVADVLGQLADTLVAAVFVNDPAVFDQFVRWLRRVAYRRGIPSHQIDQVLSRWHKDLEGVPKARCAIGVALEEA
ncbi:cobalamin B12-binding domain-containing protein [Allokutzneria oryzae]|uniref:B12-binding domain-containing protein n=1 Tax=Allokutzneria oryzae TaxID=1378989 RepID=A0ABV6A1A7_9PSEU